ncbi:MAG TPA: 16S rRNA (uracil(1498)-N(3))-methyltransferase [Mycobacteriales bacterium]|nr:16S rRNA (uracil(1498)-N(3))-methyltransferase [Mycobacteriales bacterium]
MTAPLFLVPADVLASAGAGDVVVLDGDEGRHAADVRRLRAGEQVSVGDGVGVVVRGEVAEVGRGRLTVSVRERVVLPRREPRLVVVQALAKGGRDEDAVEAMTEVGVDEVLGWSASRSVARWTDRTAAKWTASARAAAKQSRSAWVPVVGGPMSSAQVADRLRAATVAAVLHEEAEVRLASVAVPPSGEVVVVVGPEGGIAPDELALFAEAGAMSCRLGDAVLRSSTAGVVALSVLSATTRWR